MYVALGRRGHRTELMGWLVSCESKELIVARRPMVCIALDRGVIDAPVALLHAAVEFVA